MKNFILDTETKIFRLKYNNCNNYKQVKITLIFKDNHIPLYIFVHKYQLVAENFIGKTISFYANTYDYLYKPIKKLKRIYKINDLYFSLIPYNKGKLTYINSKDIYDLIKDIKIEESNVPSLIICGCSHSYNHGDLPYFSWPQYLQLKIINKYALTNLSISGINITSAIKIGILNKIKNILTDKDKIFLMYTANDFKCNKTDEEIEILSNKYQLFINNFVNNMIYFVWQHPYPGHVSRDINNTEKMLNYINIDRLKHIKLSPDKEMANKKYYADFSTHTNYDGAKYISEKYFSNI